MFHVPHLFANHIPLKILGWLAAICYFFGTRWSKARILPLPGMLRFQYQRLAVIDLHETVRT
ncbi:hypothetical protein BHC62_06160 [Pseudomonas sp. 06C 126]|nr:hypothetical protein BHC62_06160 [Pseudomonas sp. 06C 126]